MVTVTAKLSSRNQMVLPKAAREALGVKPGGNVLVIIEGDSVRLFSEPDDWAEYMRGLGKEMWAQLGGGEKFIREERASWETRDSAMSFKDTKQ
jgi:AbrB family looped-hinge helix DNA binding protein